MYYLQSRCYNPEIGRFISRDNAQYHEGDTGVKANLYAYCDNNPVMNSDPEGNVCGNHWWNSKAFVPWVIDTLIDIAICGGLGIVRSCLRKMAVKYGMRKAAVLFSRSLRSSLLRRYIGSTLCNKVLGAIIAAFSYLLYRLDPGYIIFRYLDSRDRRPNNGYLNY